MRTFRHDAMYVACRVMFIAGAIIAIPVRSCIMVGVAGTTLAALLKGYKERQMMRQVGVQ
jgi:hypothetical protein